MANINTLKRILGDAVQAPSGDNSQPWRFEIRENELYIYNITESDSTLYNFRQRGSYFAHGALIENIYILSLALGYRADISYFPGIRECTAKIIFSESSSIPQPLISAIANRATNRNPYEEKGLDSSHKKEIFDSILSHPIKLHLIEDKDDIDLLASSVSLNERLIMENQQMHDFLFGVIRWSLKEEKKKPGLYIKTMGLPFPVEFLFRFLLRYWNIVKLLNIVGFSKSLPKQTNKLYKASSALGAIIVRKNNDREFILAGRAFQRVWLTATNLGLVIHPITALPYLMQRINENETESLTTKHINLIKGAYKNISAIFTLESDENIAMLFRIGYGPKMLVRSSKLAPKVVIK